MAVTETTLLAVAGFATLCTIGMFFDYGDDWTRCLVGAVAAVTWALVSLNAFNVLLPQHRPEATTVSLPPVIWLAGGLAIVTFLFTLRLLLNNLKEEAESASFDAFR